MRPREIPLRPTIATCVPRGHNAGMATAIRAMSPLCWTRLVLHRRSTSAHSCRLGRLTTLTW
eukprot:365347-Chlamydomonas_euryale.AAC.19